MTTTDTTTVRLSGRAGLLAAVPAMLGFHPRESIVMMCLSGPRRRVGPVIRIDLENPDCPPDQHYASIAQLQAHAQRHSDEIALICYTETLCRSALFDELFDALEQGGARILDAVLVRAGRAHTMPNGQRGTQTPAEKDGTDFHFDAGTQLPDDSDPQVFAMAAATAFNGRGILADRQALRDSIAGPTGASAAKASAALHAAADGLLSGVGPSDPIDRDRLAAMAVKAVDKALRQVAGHGTVESDVCAVITLLLCDVGIRDRVIARAVQELDEPWLPMLIALSRAAPAADAAEICAVLAVAAYRRGDGALAQVSIDRTLLAEPRHRLARLMLDAMAAGLPPHDMVGLAAAITDVSPEMGG